MSFPKFNPNVRKVQIQGCEFRLAALPTGLMVGEILPLFDKVKAGANLTDDTPLMAKAIAESMSRAGYNTTPEEVMEGTDTTQLIDIFFEVVRTNGFKAMEEDAEGKA